MYSNDEMNDMLFCYYASNRNVNQASEMYLQRFMERRQPDKKVFSRLEKNLRRYGAFMKPKGEKVKFKEEDEERVLAYANFKPQCSIRELARECDVSKEKSRLILKQNNLRAFRYHIGNTLHQNDTHHRLEYARWFIDQVHQNPNFCQTILFTDESQFTNNGVFNTHNRLYWSDNNPHLTVSRRDQRRFSINVWCGILGQTIVGPYFYEGTLTGERFLHFLQNDLEEMLDNMPLNLYGNLQYFQYDGAPAHNCNRVTNYLDQRFPLCIGKAGPISWPPRSPDLTPLDFFCGVPLKIKFTLKNLKL